MEFFEKQVDTKANLLNLSVFTYVKNEWAKECASIMRNIADDIIHPFMELLGIDEHKFSSHPDRNWFGVKKFFEAKIPWLESKVPKLQKSSHSVDKLYAACVTEVVDALKRQMSVVKFFVENHENMDPAVLEKMKGAALGNLGCESNFARLDNRLKTCGGAPSLSTLSMKAVVHQNGYFSSKEFKEMGVAERMELWEWAKNSKPAKSYMQLQIEWLKNVKAAKEVAVQAAIKSKKTQALNFSRLLDDLRGHGGPLAISNIKLLDTLTESQVLLEIRFIRQTMNPNIRQQRKVKVPDGKNYMQKFSLPELVDSVRSHLMPASNVTSTVEELLADIYSQNKYHGRRVRKKFTVGGVTDWYDGDVTGCYDPGINALYQIVYDDADEETLSLGELLQYIVVAESAGSPRNK